MQQYGRESCTGIPARKKESGSESGDLNRINRQKKMLIAIFDKLKRSCCFGSTRHNWMRFKGNLYTTPRLPRLLPLRRSFQKLTPIK
jgi:hypothetical protein